MSSFTCLGRDGERKMRSKRCLYESTGLSNQKRSAVRFSDESRTPTVTYDSWYYVKLNLDR